VNYKNAWKCKKCPETNNDKGCPMWWEVVMKNDETGETKVEKGCGFQLLPQMMALVSTNSLHSVAASYDMRNKVVKNVGRVITAVNEKLQLDFSKEEVDEMSSVDGEVLIEDQRREDK